MRTPIFGATRRIDGLIRVLLVVSLLTASTIALALDMVGTTITYQGRLTQAGGFADGAHDFHFILYDAATLGLQVGTTVSLAGVAVDKGLFTVDLDFGATAFNGEKRWLSVSVQPAGGGSYTTLTPRQELTASPHALWSMKAADANALEGFDASAFAAVAHSHDASNIDSGVLSIARIPATVTEDSEVMTIVLGDDGPGSGLDADRLDGQEGAFYRNVGNLNGGTLGTDYFSAYVDLGAEGYLDNSNNSDLLTRSQLDSRYVQEGQGGAITSSMIVDGATLAEIADDDGSGSGLDADRLDGHDTAFFLNVSNVNAGTLNTGRYSAYGDLGIEGYLSNNGDTDLVTRIQADGRYVNEGQTSSINSSMITNGQVASVDLADGAALAEILDDDGSGSGLDADRLDGQEGAYYRNADMVDSLHGAQFLRSDASDTFSGSYLYFNTGSEIWATYGSASVPSYAFANDTNTGIFHPTNDTISLTRGSAESLRVGTYGVSTLRRLNVGAIGPSTGYNRFGTRSPRSLDMNDVDDLLISDDLEVGESAYLSKYLYMEGNYSTGQDAEQWIYFYNSNSRNGEFFGWDDSEDAFRITDVLKFENGAERIESDSYDINLFCGQDCEVMIDATNNGTGDWFRVYHDGTFVSSELLAEVQEDGDLRIRGTLSQNTSFDIAEMFYMARPVEPGDVVRVVDGRSNAVAPATDSAGGAVIGVVSEAPGIVLGGGFMDVESLDVWGADVRAQFEEEQATLEAEEMGENTKLQAYFGALESIGQANGATDADAERLRDEEVQMKDELTARALERFGRLHFAPIAIAGRVPVKVNARYGAISVGDPLEASPTPGVARIARAGSVVIGTALEGIDRGEGKILMLVSRAHVAPTRPATTASLDVEAQQSADARISLLEGQVAELLREVKALKTASGN